MPSFADSIFLFVLALLLFGPKKLPVLARELGKWVGEFRRASNEFKMQMEDELRASEQADRQKQIAAMEAAAPIPPPLDEPEHPHLRHNVPPAPSLLAPQEDGADTVPSDPQSAAPETAHEAYLSERSAEHASSSSSETPAPSPENSIGVRPLPIATSGDLHMMPPATGLPKPRGRNGSSALDGLLDSIPEATAEPATEAAAHGD